MVMRAKAGTSLARNVDLEARTWVQIFLRAKTILDAFSTLASGVLHLE